jgi:hypothetical protein
MLTQDSGSIATVYPFPPASRRPAFAEAASGEWDVVADGNVLRVACDPAEHHICVVDAEGALLEVFGEHGSLPGQFDQPSDVIVVSPRFDGEDAGVARLDLLVVADRGNHRLQVFEPEGQLVAIIGAPSPSDAGAASGGREGWPFFRPGPHAYLHDPAQLRWEDPWLVVIDGAGRETRVDLAEALLPSFDEWLAAASTPLLAAAHHHFRHKVRNDSLAEPLASIETALGCAWLSAGDVDAVSRLWSLGWAPQLAMATRDQHAAERDRAAMRAAFRLGGAAPVARVRAAIRLSMGVFAAWPGADRDGGRATREAS